MSEIMRRIKWIFGLTDGPAFLDEEKQEVKTLEVSSAKDKLKQVREDILRNEERFNIALDNLEKEIIKNGRR